MQIGKEARSGAGASAGATSLAHAGEGSVVAAAGVGRGVTAGGGSGRVGVLNRGSIYIQLAKRENFVNVPVELCSPSPVASPTQPGPQEPLHHHSSIHYGAHTGHRGCRASGVWYCRSYWRSRTGRNPWYAVWLRMMNIDTGYVQSAAGILSTMDVQIIIMVGEK